jgi:hypothetical protein
MFNFLLFTAFAISILHFAFLITMRPSIPGSDRCLQNALFSSDANYWVLFQKSIQPKPLSSLRVPDPVDGIEFGVR